MGELGQQHHRPGHRRRLRRRHRRRGRTEGHRTLTRGEATAYRNFDIRVWSQAELDKEAAKSELRKLVERLDGTITLTPEYGRDTNVNTMLSAKLDDSSIAVSVSKVEEVYGGAGVATDGTITYFFADPNTTPLVHNGSYNVTFALSKAGATETLQVPVVISWDVQRVRDAIMEHRSGDPPRSRASSPPRACAPPVRTRTSSRRI